MRQNNPSLRNRVLGSYYGIKEEQPENKHMDWDAISRLENANLSNAEKTKKTSKPSLFKRFFRAIFGLNLLFGSRSDSSDKPPRKRRKLSYDKYISFPWKGLFGREMESVTGDLEPKPVANTTSIDVFWAPKSPLVQRDPVTNKPIPPVEEILNVTRAASRAARERYNNYRQSSKPYAPVFNFPEVIALTTIDDLLSETPAPEVTPNAPPAQVPPMLQMRRSPILRSRRRHFYDFKEASITDVPEFPIPTTPVIWDTQAPFRQLEEPVKFAAPTPQPPRSLRPIEKFCQEKSYQDESVKPNISSPKPEDKNSGFSSPEPPHKPAIFTSRIRFPRSLGVGHITYKLRPKPKPHGALRRPSWATLTSHHSDKEPEDFPRSTSPALSYSSRRLLSGPHLQFPPIFFNNSKYRPGLNEDEEKEEEKEPRPIYDITFYNRPGPGAIVLALAEFEVPEGYDEDYASVHVDYGEDGGLKEMEAYKCKEGEAEKLKDSGVVVFMFLSEE